MAADGCPCYIFRRADEKAEDTGKCAWYPLPDSKMQQTSLFLPVVRSYWGARIASTASIGNWPQLLSFSFPARM
jgi:hypothetical protein